MIKINKEIRDYLLNQGFNNKLLLDVFIKGIINDDLSQWTLLLNNDEVVDPKMIIRDHKINMILN